MVRVDEPSQGLRVQLEGKEKEEKRQGRARRRGVGDFHRHTRRAESVDTAASGQGFDRQASWCTVLRGGSVSSKHHIR